MKNKAVLFKPLVWDIVLLAAALLPDNLCLRWGPLLEDLSSLAYTRSQPPRTYQLTSHLHPCSSHALVLLLLQHHPHLSIGTSLEGIEEGPSCQAQ